ncbi:hypothetical protein EV715DRAFT_198134, partial [Schizophyllum commune]
LPQQTSTVDKLAMSRALGAAFLSHQVQQLESAVSERNPNWRDRKLGPRKPPPNVPRRRGGDVERPRGEAKGSRRSGDHTREKDADVVIVDASVLVHALGQVKKWCREGREEIVIIPLEALNTLDLLKKGSSALAVRARAASRVLEAQVGTNPRIRVQQDDAYVLWGKLGLVDGPTASPEWVRRIICCARYEVEHPPPKADDSAAKIILAVATTPMAPVPLPAPVQGSKHEIRASGGLVAQWAAKAGLEVLHAKTTPPGGARSSFEDDEGSDGPRIVKQRPHTHPNPHRPRRNTPPSGPGALVERPAAVKTMMEMVAQPSRVVRVLARGEKLEPDSAVSAAPQSALQWQRLRSSRLDAAGVTISGTYDPADTGASGHSVRHLREGGFGWTTAKAMQGRVV